MMRELVVTLCAWGLMTAGCEQRTPPIGPPPTVAVADQLTRLNGHWRLMLVQAKAEIIPFRTIAIADDGRQVSIDRAGAKATLVGSEYLRPYPGGESVRATFAVTADNLTYSLWIDWPDNPAHLMFGQLSGGNLDGFRMLQIERISGANVGG
jgi:hypothetical protein